VKTRHRSGHEIGPQRTRRTPGWTAHASCGHRSPMSAFEAPTRTSASKALATIGSASRRVRRWIVLEMRREPPCSQPWRARGPPSPCIALQQGLDAPDVSTSRCRDIPANDLGVNVRRRARGTTSCSVLTLHTKCQLEPRLTYSCGIPPLAYEAYVTDVQKAKFGTFVQLTPEEAKCPTSQPRSVTR